MNHKINLIIKNKVLIFSISLFSFFPILPNKIKGVPVILLLVVSFFCYKKKNIILKPFLINTSLYLLFLASYVFFYNNNQSVDILETTLSVFILPFIFNCLISKDLFDSKTKINFYNFFILSSFIFSVIILFSIVFDNSTVYYSNWYTNKARTIIENFPYIGQHPIYASVFFSVAIFFALDILKNIRKGTQKSFLYMLSISFNVFLVLLFLSKAVVIALFFTFFHIFSKIRWSKRKGIVLFLSLILFFSLFYFNRRMHELVDFQSYEQIDPNYSTGIRISIYKCAFDLLKENWMLGYGAGNTQQSLNSCYERTSSILLEKTYNSHNQYLDITLKTGVLGLYLFIVFILYNYYKAKKDSNEIVMYLLIFYSILFIFENILLRQSGVILFYFLLMFLQNYKVVETKRELDV